MKKRNSFYKTCYLILLDLKMCHPESSQPSRAHKGILAINQSNIQRNFINRHTTSTIFSGANGAKTFRFQLLRRSPLKPKPPPPPRAQFQEGPS